jgi:SAM-dependent methyltransferase
MDQGTVAFYDENAATLADFYESHRPTRLYELIAVYFRTADALTIDLGCGSGRDAEYLRTKDYKVLGVDASEQMLNEARSRHPGIEFRRATLPDLRELRDECADNILCAGVFMHLPEVDFIPAAMGLKRVLKRDGVLILSFRSNDGADDGRLFSPIPPGRLALLFESLGMRVLHQETSKDSAGRSHLWNTLVVQNTVSPMSDGISRVQSILEHDNKVATYKLALIRALCMIALREPSSVSWSAAEDQVFVPVRKIAEHWIRFYWPFDGVRQNRGPKDIAFRPELDEVKGSKLPLKTVMDQLSEGDADARVDRLLKKISRTLIVGPVQHSGGRSSPVFGYWNETRSRRLDPAKAPQSAISHFVSIPAQIWRDVLQFNQWIHDSVLIRWADLTTRQIAKDQDFSHVLSLLRQDYMDTRNTMEIRRWLLARGSVESVWSGRSIAAGQFHVDHVVPFTVLGNNDLWNMLPATDRENSQKSDRLPSLGVLERSRDRIFSYWEFYRSRSPRRMERQLRDAFGVHFDADDWQRRAFNHLVEMTERIATTRALERWAG